MGAKSKRIEKKGWEVKRRHQSRRAHAGAHLPVFMQSRSILFLKVHSAFDTIFWHEDNQPVGLQLHNPSIRLFRIVPEEGARVQLNRGAAGMLGIGVPHIHVIDDIRHQLAFFEGLWKWHKSKGSCEASVHQHIGIPARFPFVLLHLCCCVLLNIEYVSWRYWCHNLSAPRAGTMLALAMHSCFMHFCTAPCQGQTSTRAPVVCTPKNSTLLGALTNCATALTTQ
jgi:hypothetical protein